MITPVTGVPNAPVSAAHDAPQQAAANRSVVQAVKAVNATEMFGQDTHLAFQRDPQTQRMVIQVINADHQVVLQIPPEYVLALAEDLKHQEATASAGRTA